MNFRFLFIGENDFAEWKTVPLDHDGRPAKFVRMLDPAYKPDYAAPPEAEVPVINFHALPAMIPIGPMHIAVSIYFQDGLDPMKMIEANKDQFSEMIYLEIAELIMQWRMENTGGVFHNA